MVSRRLGFWASAIWVGLLLCAGCATPAPPQTSGVPPPVRGLALAPAARQALEAALQAYAKEEDLKPLEAMLPARYVGRSLLLDAARTALNQQKQINIKLSELSYQLGDMPPGSVAISAHWEKRFLKLPGLVPTLESGTLQTLMHIEAGQWVLDALSADNPLTR